MRGRAAILIALAAILLAAPLAPADPQASLPDVEDEVMCPICGTLLELSQSPQAERERVFIRRLIAEGATKQEIKDALVDEYGREVLAVPESSGFQLSAYWVPIAGFGAAALLLGLGVARWRRRARDEPEEEAPAPDGEDASRLDADLARYDL